MARNKDTLDFIVNHWQDLSRDLNDLLDYLMELENVPKLNSKVDTINELATINSNILRHLSRLIDNDLDVDNADYNNTYDLDDLYTHVEIFNKCVLELLSVMSDDIELQIGQVEVCLKQFQCITERVDVILSTISPSFRQFLLSNIDDISNKLDELDNIKRSLSIHEDIKAISNGLASKSISFNDNVQYNPLSYTADKFLDPVKHALEILVMEMQKREPNYDQILEYSIELSKYLQQAINWYHTTWWQNIGGKSARSDRAREYERSKGIKK